MQSDPMVQLEQRVKALEYELKILKNEIQRTLLDVQAQVLVHYYPSLRSEDDLPPEGAEQVLESIRKKRELSRETPDLPKAKPVSLDEVRATQSETSSSSKEQSSAQPEGDLVGLLEWVTSSGESLGKERMGRLIEVYANHGFLAPDFKDTLLRVASLGSDEAAPKIMAVNEILGSLMKLNELLGRGANVEETISLIEEANLG